MGFFKSIQKAVSKPVASVAAVVQKVTPVIQKIVPPAVVNVVKAVVPTPAVKVVAAVAQRTTSNVTTLGSAVNHAASVVKTEVSKPEVVKGLQATTKIGLGVVELGFGFVPGGTVLNRAINTSLAASNSRSGGQVGAWTGIGNTNSTLNMAPGGLLAQNIAGVATNGRSNQEMNRFVPDPKRSTLAFAKTVTQQTVQTGKVSLTSVFQSAATSAPASTLHAIVNKTPLPRPSMIANIMPSIPALQRPNTITASTDSLPDNPLATIQPVEDKPSIVESLVTAYVEDTPTPPPTSTLTANTQRTISSPVTTLATVEYPSSIGRYIGTRVDIEFHCQQNSTPQALHACQHNAFDSRTATTQYHYCVN
jgi:hypothetical protein